MLSLTYSVINPYILYIYIYIMHTYIRAMGQETTMKKSCSAHAGLVGIRKNNRLMLPSAHKDGAGNASTGGGDGGDNSRLGIPSVAGGNRGVR